MNLVQIPFVLGWIAAIPAMLLARYFENTGNRKGLHLVSSVLFIPWVASALLCQDERWMPAEDGNMLVAGMFSPGRFGRGQALCMSGMFWLTTLSYMVYVIWLFLACSQPKATEVRSVESGT